MQQLGKVIAVVENAPYQIQKKTMKAHVSERASFSFVSSEYQFLTNSFNTKSLNCQKIFTLLSPVGPPSLINFIFQNGELGIKFTSQKGFYAILWLLTAFLGL